MSHRRDEEFFVGYLELPAGLRRFLRRTVAAFATLAAALAALLAAGQRPLGSGEYEFGVDRELVGVLRAEPVAALWRAVESAGGDPAIGVVPLVGEGKRGAPAAVLALAGREVRLTGRWIRRSGGRMFEVSRAVALGGENAPPTPLEPLGTTTLAGEVVDSKCYLGVMKPGEGKSHKDCAIRCISGGSPAALVARDGAGRALVALLVSREGRPLGPELLDRVAEPVEARGELLRLGDWTLLVTSRADVRRLTGGS